MIRAISALSAISLFATVAIATPPADAQDNQPTSASEATPPQSATPAPQSGDNAAAAQPAATNADATASEQKPARMHKMVMHRHGSDMDDEANALNALSAAGYTDIRNLQKMGENLSATASKDGKDAHVQVSPDGQIQPAG